MPTVKISPAALRAIAEAAIYPFKPSGSFDGVWWHVTLSYDVVNALHDHKLTGESLSDTILRLAHAHKPKH